MTSVIRELILKENGAAKIYTCITYIANNLINVYSLYKHKLL